MAENVKSTVFADYHSPRNGTLTSALGGFKLLAYPQYSPHRRAQRILAPSRACNEVLVSESLWYTHPPD